MNTQFTIITCPQCVGVGHTEQGTIRTVCPACAGAGSWLETPTHTRLFYTIPAHLDHPDTLRQQRLIRYGLAAASTIGLVISTGSILIRGGYSFEEFFWQRGWVDALFGVSGLGLAFNLSALQINRSGRSSFHVLDEYLSNPERQEISLNPFASANLNELLAAINATCRETGQQVADEGILLLALLKLSRIRSIIARLEHSATEIEEVVRYAYQQNHPPAKITSTPDVGTAVRYHFQQGAAIAIANQFPYLEAEDLLLSLIKQPGEQSTLFSKYGIDFEEVLAVARWYAHEEDRAARWAFWLEKGRSRPKGYMNRAWTALPTKFLDQFSIDLTQRAARGQVASGSAREQELEQILAALGRTQKNSVLLIGDPGVGKGTVIEGIALHMVEGNVPETLQDKRLVSLDLAALLAQSGEAEQYVQQVLEEVTAAGNVILAIQDIHLLIGTTSGALDAASVMASALSQGAIQVISTASYAEYHRYVEANPALSNILETVEIKEVTPEQAIDILEEEAPGIESRQQVIFTYPAIKAAVTLAKRYIAEHVLPESASSLLDQAGSAAHLSNRKWVTRADIEATLEQKLGIPVGEATGNQATRLLNLETELHKQVIGQDEAVVAVADSIRRSAAGLHDGKRPVSTFLFVGPTGVGKTELAKAITTIYFGDPKLMVRLDMSEYQDARSVYRLIGAPAASAEEHTEGGALTQPFREHPHSLLLLDELEKAHPDVLNLFLQLLDDGRLTENTGRTVNFSNSIVIATSNAGSSDLLKVVQTTTDPEIINKSALQILQQYFKPEFLNRFDRIVPFHPLTLPHVEAVTRLLLDGVITKLAAQKYTITFAPESITKIAQLGYDPAFGARPLRRVIQDKVEGPLATLILEGKLLPGTSLQITPEMIQ